MRILLITVLFVFSGLPLLSQKESVPPNEDIVAEYEDLFSAQEPLHLTLKLDVRAFTKTKTQDVYHDAEMIYGVNENFQVSHPVQIKARETIRQRICNLPPMWLKIGNSETKTDPLPEKFRMNIVVRCKNTAQFEPYVLREYLVYKIFNILTPLSYRVRLVRLSIVDTGKGNEVSEDWAFIQEPDELLALRMKGKIIENDKLAMNSMNPEIMNSLSMSQYMIGNADYAVTGSYKLNFLVLNSGEHPGFLPVPYDFDYSGLVNTDYAIPGESLGISSVRERYYLFRIIGPGFNRRLTQVAETIAYAEHTRLGRGFTLLTSTF